MSETNRPGYPPTGPQFPPGGYWRPPPPRRTPPYLLIVLIVAALFLGVTGGWDRVWQALSPSLQSSPWTHSAPLPPPRAPGTSRAAVSDAGVVDVDTQLGYQNAAGAGTGIVLSPSGEILTNNHVISGATRITVTDVGTGRSYPATVIGYDRRHDIALLRVQGASGLPTAPIGDSDKVAIGDQIAAIGNAGGVGGPPSVAPGRVSALDRTITASDAHEGSAQQLTGLIQIVADVEPGDSGGPLVNAAGQVVGMDTAASTGFRFESASGEGFAIPINDAIDVAKHIESGSGSPTIHIGPTGVLGIAVQDSGRYGPAGPGAAVVGVLPGLPAERAGLVAGDVVVAADGTTINSAATLTRVLNSRHPGDQVRLSWLDLAGQQHDATVALAAGPPN